MTESKTKPEKLLDDALASLGNFLLGDESVFTMEMKLKFARETCDAIHKWKNGRSAMTETTILDEMRARLSGTTDILEVYLDSIRKGKYRARGLLSGLEKIIAENRVCARRKK